VSSEPRDLPALTPNMLLSMKSNASIRGRGIFEKEYVYSKKW
jgi:hypothetical protein